MGCINNIYFWSFFFYSLFFWSSTEVIYTPYYIRSTYIRSTSIFWRSCCAGGERKRNVLPYCFSYSNSCVLACLVSYNMTLQVLQYDTYERPKSTKPLFFVVVCKPAVVQHFFFFTFLGVEAGRQADRLSITDRLLLRTLWICWSGRRRGGGKHSVDGRAFMIMTRSANVFFWLILVISYCRAGLVAFWTSIQVKLQRQYVITFFLVSGKEKNEQKKWKIAVRMRKI